MLAKQAPISLICFAALLRDARRIQQPPYSLDPILFLLLPHSPTLLKHIISGTLSFVPMPSIIFDSTTRMPGIAFGIPTAAMSNGSQAGSSRSTSAPKRDECKECKQMNHKGHRHARDPKFCPKRKLPSISILRLRHVSYENQINAPIRKHILASCALSGRKAQSRDAQPV